MSKLVKAPPSDYKVIGALRVGQLVAEVQVDASKLVEPERVYDADFSWVTSDRGQVSLWFAKLGPTAGRLTSRLELRYPAEDFVRVFINSTRKFRTRLAGYVEQWTREGSGPMPNRAAVPKLVHSEWVNFSQVSFSGSEACMDFHHLSPSGIARYMKSGDTTRLDMKPVVRVMMTTFELLNLVDQSLELESTLNSVLPDVHLKQIQADADTQEESD